ncbi:hypothetical protein [Ochrobactrum sp. MYb379]|uniref:hypothetical protein n=1 Tax=Ochrobactrum sp. MYb379 TaxID=2745275 RepID=UPI00309B10C9
MDNEDVTEIEIRDAIYSHVCQLLIADVNANQVFKTAVQTYEHAYGVKIKFRDSLLKPQEDNK